MNKTMKSISVLLLSACMLLQGLPVHAETPDTYKIELKDVPTDENGNYVPSYEETIEIDGATYVFSSVEYRETTERDVLSIESARVLATEQTPEEKNETVVEGVKYVLTGREVTRDVESGRTVKVNDELSRNAIKEPEAKPSVEKEVTDEVTGEEFIAVLPFKESVFEKTEWVRDMTFPVRFDGYNEPLILFAGEIIPRNDRKPLTEDKYPLLLRYAELPSSVVRIYDVLWDGAAATDSKGVYRNATAYAETLHEEYTDYYELEYSLPDLTYVTYTYEYTESDESYFARRKADATVYYRLESKSFQRSFTDFVTSTGGIVTIAVAAFVIIALIVLFIILKNVRRKKEKA